MQSVNTSLTVTNETDVRGEAMADLIAQYITLKNCRYGLLTQGDNPQKIQYPALFIEPKSQRPQLATTGKYQLDLSYAIYWYVLDNQAEDTVTLSTFIGEALVKLFSNNALGDLGTAVPPSHHFRSYEPFWTDSDMKGLTWSPIYQDVVEGHTEKYMRIGRLMIDITTWVIK